MKSQGPDDDQDVLTVRADHPLKDAAALLAEHRISGLPVVDDERHVLGVLSEGDILFKESGAGAPAELLDRLLSLRPPTGSTSSWPPRRSARRCRRRR